uniref:F-box/LRR-repeat protein At3g26922-like n=1 Tax=Erigeron canadensis TaxID=72917 RepID=UPI001CB9CCB6|nr:F-box/LRR-repeat protein At3g26922-like [Erigeron canadensis]
MAENVLENSVSISSIPYEVLYQIVSLIPLKEAARTIILSSAWKHLWTPIQVSLNINSDQITSQESGQQMNEIISSFLKTYENSYQILNLSYLEPNSLCKEALLLKAIKGVEKELYINFHGENAAKLFGLTIELPLCENEHFFSLKTLHLRSITGIAESFLPSLFSSCRNLESLSLEKCNVLQDVELKAHDLLQKFSVLDCEKIKHINVSSAPNLKSFVYQGPLVKVLVKDAPKLCDVTLNMKGTSALCDSNEFNSEDLVHLLASFKDVETLTLSGWLLEWLCTRITFDELEFKFEKLKELSWIDCCMNTQKRDSLASFLNITPLLENLFIKINKKWGTITRSQFQQCCPQVWPDTIPIKLDDSQLKHLKTVTFFGFKIKEENKMLAALMDLLLKKAIAIKKMSVAEPEEKLSWGVSKVPKSHLRKIRVAAASTRTCYSSKSSLLLTLNEECHFQLTPLQLKF